MTIVYVSSQKRFNTILPLTRHLVLLLSVHLKIRNCVVVDCNWVVVRPLFSFYSKKTRKKDTAVNINGKTPLMELTEVIASISNECYKILM